MGIRRISMVVASLALLGSTAACTGTISGDEVVKNLEPVLVQRGADEGSMKCPDDLDGKVGATTKCSATMQGKTIGFTVKVTKVDGSRANFEVVSVDQPK